MAAKRSARRGHRRTVADPAAVCALVFAAALILCGCAAGSAPHTSSTPATSRELKPLTRTILASTLAASVQKNLVPGAFAVVTTPTGAVSAGYGTTRLGTSHTSRASDVFSVRVEPALQPRGRTRGIQHVCRNRSRAWITLVIWTNLALAPDGQATAKAVAGPVIAQLYRTKLGTPALPANED